MQNTPFCAQCNTKMIIESKDLIGMKPGGFLEAPKMTYQVVWVCPKRTGFFGDLLAHSHERYDSILTDAEIVHD